MAQGSIVWRCWTCRGNKSVNFCKHPGAGYSIVLRIGGRQKWEAVGTNKKDAERRLAEIRAELYQGTFRDPKPILFRDFAKRWLRDYAEGAVKPLTLRSYRDLVRLYLDPAFGDMLLAQMMPEHIQGFLARCVREKNLSPRTANYLLSILKMMFRHARQWRLLRTDPTEDIKPLRQERKEMDYLGPNEIRLLLEAADEPYRTLFLTAVLTGMRLGEVLGLQWGDIDWRSSVIRVRRSLFRYKKREVSETRDGQKALWRFSTPKSERSIRTIVMSPRLKEALELHRITGPVSEDDLVFCRKKGTPLDGNNMIKREFHVALSRAGLRRIRFHDLRHTYTALLIAQGAHAKFIQSQLGHASIQTTLDRYGHLLPEVQDGTGERLDAVVFGTTFPEKLMVK